MFQFTVVVARARPGSLGLSLEVEGAPGGARPVGHAIQFEEARGERLSVHLETAAVELRCGLLPARWSLGTRNACHPRKSG
jgi:hypothetical protein